MERGRQVKGLIGPIRQEALDICLQQSFPTAHFFAAHEWNKLTQLQPDYVLLLEPFARPLPAEIWTLDLPRLALGHLPLLHAAQQREQFQHVLDRLHAFWPLHWDTQRLLPSQHSEVLWPLSLSELSNTPARREEVYPYLLVLEHNWSRQMPYYHALEKHLDHPLDYFPEINALRLGSYFPLATCVLLDAPLWTRSHFQALAAGARLFIAPHCQGIPPELRAGVDYHVMDRSAQALAQELKQARQTRPQRPDLTAWSLDQRLPSLIDKALSSSLAQSRPLPLSAQSWLQEQSRPLQGAAVRVAQEALQGLQSLQSSEARLLHRACAALLQVAPEAFCSQSFELPHVDADATGAIEALETAVTALKRPDFQLPALAPWQHTALYRELSALYPECALELWLRYWHVALQNPPRWEALDTLLKDCLCPASLELYVRHAPQTKLFERWLQAPQYVPLGMAYLRAALAQKSLSSAQLDALEQDWVSLEKRCQHYVTQQNLLEDLLPLKVRIAERRQAIATPPGEHEACRLPRPIYLLWEGPAFAQSSLAIINRRWLELLSTREDLLLTHIPFEPREMRAPEASWRKLQAQEPDLLVSHHWPPRNAPPRTGKWVSIIPWEFGVIPSHWAQFLAQSHDEVWVPSAFVARSFVLSGLKPEQLRVIPNGVDPQLFQPEGPSYPLKSRKKLKFLFVGGLLPRKGVDLLLQAYENAFKADDDVLLVIKSFGDSSHYARNLFQWEEKANTPDVEWIQEDLSPQELAALYRSCDVYVHPYRGEGFGMPILEAMASGLPVIIPNAGPAPEFCPPAASWQLYTRISFALEQTVQDLGPARSHPYFSEVDREHLSQCFREAVQQPEQRRAKALAARQSALDLTWERIAPRLVSAIQSVSKRPVAQLQRIQEPEQYRSWQEALRSECALSTLQVLGQEWGRWPAQMPELILPQGEPIGSIPRLQNPKLRHLRLAQANAPTGQTPGIVLKPCPPLQSETAETCPKAFQLAYWTSSQAPAHWPSGALAIAHRGLYTQALEVHDGPLFHLPLGVDFEHFHPAQKARRPEGAEGRFVFLSLVDWQNKQGWQDLLTAYFQSFTARDSVFLSLCPLGQDFDAMAAELMDWLEHAPWDLDAIPELGFEQADFRYDTLPGMLRGADCFVSAEAQGQGSWALAAQASGLPVISCAHFPFLERPCAEPFTAGDLSHLGWLLRSHVDTAGSQHNAVRTRAVRLYLQPEHDAQQWYQRLEDGVLRQWLRAL